jgi:uncharacterized protein (TIGR01777 family)
VRVLISGSSGMIGRAVARSLAGDGHEVSRLVRPKSSAAGAESVAAWDVRWDPASGDFDADAAEGADAVIHLAGASIGDGRWTPERKELLRTSRVDATRNLVSGLATLNTKPKVFIAASAVGFFGDRGDEKLTEYSGPGHDFLAALTRNWERESQLASDFGARAVMPRFGIVLSTSDGALPRMALPIKLFVGGKLGSGRQWTSWITLADAVGVIRFALENEAVRGPVNAVAPNPERNADFTRALAHALHRPAIFPAPAFALRLLLGEMADALLLSSQRALPERLLSLGFSYKDPELPAALQRIVSEGA